MCTPNCCLALLAIVFPPLAVCLMRGCCAADFWINIALFVLGYFPGLLHAWFIIYSGARESSGHASRPEYTWPNRIIVVGNVPGVYSRQQLKANATLAGTYGAVGANRPIYVQEGYHQIPSTQVTSLPEHPQLAICAPDHCVAGPSSRSPWGVSCYPYNQNKLLPQQQQPQPQCQPFQKQQYEQLPPQHGSGSSSSTAPAPQQPQSPAGPQVEPIPSAPLLGETDAPPRYEEIDTRPV